MIRVRGAVFTCYPADCQLTTEKWLCSSCCPWRAQTERHEPRPSLPVLLLVLVHGWTRYPDPRIRELWALSSHSARRDFQTIKVKARGLMKGDFISLYMSKGQIGETCPRFLIHYVIVLLGKLLVHVKNFMSFWFMYVKGCPYHYQLKIYSLY